MNASFGTYSKANVVLLILKIVYLILFTYCKSTTTTVYNTGSEYAEMGLMKFTHLIQDIDVSTCLRVKKVNSGRGILLQVFETSNSCKNIPWRGETKF